MLGHRMVIQRIPAPLWKGESKVYNKLKKRVLKACLRKGRKIWVLLDAASCKGRETKKSTSGNLAILEHREDRKQKRRLYPKRKGSL